MAQKDNLVLFLRIFIVWLMLWLESRWLFAVTCPSSPNNRRESKEITLSLSSLLFFCKHTHHHCTSTYDVIVVITLPHSTSAPSALLHYHLLIPRYIGEDRTALPFALRSAIDLFAAASQISLSLTRPLLLRPSFIITS